MPTYYKCPPAFALWSYGGQEKPKVRVFTDLYKYG